MNRSLKSSEAELTPKKLRIGSHSSSSGLSKFLFGVDYYPEHDTEEDSRGDIQRLINADVNVVRMTDFAWDILEPEEGSFEFAFFDAHIERLGKNGIRTILCTPTAAPPRWLTKKYPEVLRMNRDGAVLKHGSRQHASHCSPLFREFSKRITSAMAEHYRENPFVIGWQIDNEFHCHFSEDYSESAQAAFRDFLRRKYSSIETLNRDWGTRVWAQTYSDFEDIDCPYPNRPTYENPSHRLEYLRFLSQAVTNFQGEQAEILRAANPSWWVTHNGIFNNIDYRELARDLDFMGVDIYPMFGGPAERPCRTARKLDKTRSFSGNFIVLELQSGPGGQGDYMHERPEPGEMRLFAWQCIAHGADSLLHFRWRSCRFGAEEYWEGVLDHDNKLRARYAEFVQEGAELERLGGEILGTVLRPEVGFLYDSGTAEMAHQPVTLGLPSPAEVADVLFTEWWRKGFNVGYVHPLDDLSCFKLLFLPCFSVVTPEVAGALKSWVKQGGTLVILPQSGRKDSSGRVLAETPPGPLAELAGCEVAEYSRVNRSSSDERPSHAFLFNGKTCIEHLWREVLLPTTGAIVGTWQTGRLEGTGAVIKHGVGDGTCYYIGTYPNAKLAETWIASLADVAGVRPLISATPEGVEVTLRAGEGKKLLFILNHTPKLKKIEGVPRGYDLMSRSAVENGELQLGAYNLAVLTLT